MSAEGGALELTDHQSLGIFGPVLGPDFSSSIELVTRLMNGMPGCPAALLRGGRRPRRRRPPRPRHDAPGRKGRTLHRHLGRHHVDARDRQGAEGAPGLEAAKKVPTRQLPNWLVRFAALVQSDAASAAAAARQHAPRHEREGRARARLEAAPPQEAHCRHRREPHPLRHRQPDNSRINAIRRCDQSAMPKARNALALRRRRQESHQRIGRLVPVLLHEPVTGIGQHDGRGVGRHQLDLFSQRLAIGLLSADRQNGHLSFV